MCKETLESVIAGWSDDVLEAISQVDGALFARMDFADYSRLFWFELVSAVDDVRVRRRSDDPDYVG